ncbi:MAG: surface-adhesin E family protein [Betaproteobacteria bacterium]
MRAKTLGTLLLGAWLALVLIGGAHAADWRTVSADETTQVYLDESSVALHGSAREAVVLVNYPSGRTLGDDWFPHRSEVVRYRLACSTGEAGLKSWAFRTGELGGGETVWKGHQPAPVLSKPADDSVESRLLAQLCSAFVTGSLR